MSGESRQERKVVSVLFVDLVGFTGHSDGRDPEDVRDVLETYHLAAGTAIKSFGGNLEKFIGDAVMAVFGAPMSHGDDAERAVRAGLEVLSAVDKLGLEARAAVNTGEAVVAVGAAATSGQALAMGDVVNTASRMQSFAPVGGLIVGAETYYLTRHTFEYQPMTAIAPKGKQDPVEVWRALAPRAAPDSTVKTPMVGRGREMQLLGSIWDGAISNRRPHLVTVLGPPGIGKSRLQREFSAAVHAQGSTLARGRCLPYGERSAYAAFTQLVRDQCGIYENDAIEVARTKLAAAIQKLLPAQESEETLFHLSVLIGLSGGQQSLQRGYLLFAARRFIEALAFEQPLLVVLEDLHWADSGLLDLVEYLATYVKDSPLVILCLARPEFVDRRPRWASGLPAHTTIGLEPLAPADSALLAAALLAESATRRDAFEQLARAGEGNPLFIEELVSSIGDRSQLEPHLPTTIRAAIASRLDALAHPARDLLLDASVVGRTFWRGVLEHFGGHPELDESLAMLEARDFIRRIPTSSVRGDIEYQFKHILTHDVAYATLPRSIRRQRHRAVAEYIESVVQDTGSLATILAHHWREAGEPQKAIEYLLQAADRALNGWALSDAVALYESALSLAATEAERDRIELARGLARSRLGDYLNAVKDLSDLLTRVTGRQRREALLGIAWALEWSEQTDETIAAAEEAISLATEADDRELVPVAKAMLSQGLAMRGEPGDLERAMEVGEEALRTWIPETRPWWRINHEHMLAEQYYWTGRLADASAVMTSASRSGSDPQSAQARLRSAALHAQVLCSIGQYEESIRIFEDTIRQAHEVNRPVRIFLNYSTQPLRELYDLAEARRRSEEALEGPEETVGFFMPRANARADLLQVSYMLGDMAAAETLWETQWAESNSTKAWTRWLMFCRLAAARAEMELEKGKFEAAAEWARKAIEVSVPVRRVKYEIVGRTLLARSLVALGKPVDAVHELNITIDAADRLGAPLLRWQAHAALARAEYAAGNDDGAEVGFATASSIIRDIAAGLASERAEGFLAAQPVSDVLEGASKTTR